MTPQRACYLHGLDIVRAYAPHLLEQHTRRLLRVVPAAEPVVVVPQPVEPKKNEPINYVKGLHAPRAVREGIAAICERHAVFYEQLCGTNRSPRLGAIRTEIYVFLRERGWSLSQIGRLMCRDHTSVVHALQKVRA